MKPIVRTYMTLDAFLRLPEKQPALDFEDGLVSRKVSPTGQHSALMHVFDERIDRQTVERSLAKAFPERRVTFSGRSYVPDIAVYRWDRIPRNPDGSLARDFFTPPDITVEIFSREQGVFAILRKCIWYIERDVKIAVLVDPEDKSVVVFRPGHSPDILNDDDRIALDDVVSDFAFTVRELFDSISVA